jgi:hypothetical protein
VQDPALESHTVCGSLFEAAKVGDCDECMSWNNTVQVLAYGHIYKYGKAELRLDNTCGHTDSTGHGLFACKGSVAQGLEEQEYIYRW